MASHDLNFIATLRTGLDVNRKHPTPRAPRQDSGPVLEVGCKDTMEAGEVQTLARHQRRQLGVKVQRLQHHVGRPIPERLFN